MSKEPLLQSRRFQMMIAGIVGNILILLLPKIGLDIDQELVNQIALVVTLLVSSKILGRSFRNTAT